MYALIQFAEKDGGTVSIVNNQWLTPRRCEVYWPPVKGTQAFNRLLSQDATPDEKWKIYGVQKIFYETDNIDKAKKKLKLVEDTSDLQTEEEAHSPKRRRLTNKRYISSEEEDYDTHIRPPPLKKKFRPLETQDIRRAQPTTNNEETSLIPENTLKPNNESMNVDNLPLLTSSILQDIRRAQPTTNNEETSLIPENTLKPNNESMNVDNLPLLTSSILQDLADETEPLSPPHQPAGSPQSQQLSCVAQLTGYQIKVLSLLTAIKTQNAQIIQMLKHSTETKGSLNPDFTFPIKTDQDLETIEELLKNKEYIDNLVSYIKKQGGRDISNKVSRVMKFIFTDQIAEQFNFYGKRSNKKPFYQLRLRDCVVDGVVATSSGATAKEVEDYIKIWLKHAPERLKKSKDNK